MKWYGKRSDKKRIMALQEACERASATASDYRLEPLQESFERLLIEIKGIIGDEISFTEWIRSNKLVDESRVWTFLFDGSGEDRKIFCELFHTSTGERLVLLLRSSYSDLSPSLEALVGFHDLHGGVHPIVPPATLSEYSKFMGKMSERPVLDHGLTRKQHEMLSSLVRTRLAYSFDLTNNTIEYGLTLAGKAVRVALKWRYLTFPVAAVFALLVISSNVNATLDLACKVLDCPWCP